jgi:hypothetical protein
MHGYGRTTESPRMVIVADTLIKSLRVISMAPRV